MIEGLISIIVPVYNSEFYLSNCLDSLLMQSYGSIEIICIDDGSTDSSLSILSDYKRRDERIKIIAKENEGVSKARNRGIEEATGEFIMFVDSDDWIDPDTCKIAIRSIADFDVVFWTYQKEYEERSEKKFIFNSDCVFIGEEFQDKVYRRLFGLIGDELMHPESSDSICTVWGKLYRREFLRGVSFVDLNEIGTYEDGLFNISVFSAMKKARYIDIALYHYRKDNNHSITTKYNPELQTQWNRLYTYMNKHIEDNELPIVFEKALNNRIAMGIVGLGLNELSTRYPNSARKIKMIITNSTYSQALMGLDVSYMPFHWKVFYTLARKGKYHCVYCLLLIIRMLIHR